MKAVSIYVDIRKSKNLTFEEKKEKFRKLYTQFSSYKPNKNNISHRDTKYVGDGIILIFNADSLNNGNDLIEIMKEIDNKVKTVEDDQVIEMGIGISYSKAFEEGNNDLFISPSIDGAAYGVNLANKCLVNEQKWKWVLPLKIPIEEEDSIEELKDIIETENKINSYESKSGKNLWFEFN